MECFTTISAFRAATASLLASVEERPSSLIFRTLRNDVSLAIVAAAKSVGLNVDERMVSADGYRVVVSGFFEDEKRRRS